MSSTYFLSILFSPSIEFSAFSAYVLTFIVWKYRILNLLLHQGQWMVFDLVITEGMVKNEMLSQINHTHTHACMPH